MSLMCSLWNQARILNVLLLWLLYLLWSSRGQGRWKFHSPHNPGASITVVAERNSQRKESMRKPSQCNSSLEPDSLLYYYTIWQNQLRCDAVEHRGRVCPWRHCDVRRPWQRSKRPAGYWHQPLALGFPICTLLSVRSPASLLSALSVHPTELLRFIAVLYRVFLSLSAIMRSM